MQKLTSLEWASPQVVEWILWVWVAVGAVVILERLMLFTTRRRPADWRFAPLSGMSLSRDERRAATTWFVQHDVGAYRRFLERYGEIATTLGMAGTLVSLMASPEFRSESSDLFPILALALRTTLVGIFAAVVVTVVFGDLAWPKLRGILEERWAAVASQEAWPDPAHSGADSDVDSAMNTVRSESKEGSATSPTTDEQEDPFGSKPCEADPTFDVPPADADDDGLT